MLKLYADILDKFANVLDINLDVHKIYLDDRIDVYDTAKSIKNILDNWDDTGLLSVLYAKNVYKEYIDGKSLKLSDLLKSTEKLDKYIELNNEFNCSEISIATKYILDMFIKILIRSDVNLLSLENIDENNILAIISPVLQSLSSCNFEFLYKGNIDNISNVCLDIHVFSTLADCMLTFEHQPDGIYLNIILDTGASAYFTYIIKSGNTLLSINDRVKESYRGKHAKSRNNRWIEHKNYDIFPYELFEYTSYDYKGYATSMKLDKDIIDMRSLGNSMISIVFAMMLLMDRLGILRI